MYLARQVSNHWKRLLGRLWRPPMRACCAKPDQDRAVDDGRSVPPRRGVFDPRVIDAFMNMRCC